MEGMLKCYFFLIQAVLITNAIHSPRSAYNTLHPYYNLNYSSLNFVCTRLSKHSCRVAKWRVFLTFAIALISGFSHPSNIPTREFIHTFISSHTYDTFSLNRNRFLACCQVFSSSATIYPIFCHSKKSSFFDVQFRNLHASQIASLISLNWTSFIIHEARGIKIWATWQTSLLLFWFPYRVYFFYLFPRGF